MSIRLFTTSIDYSGLPKAFINDNLYRDMEYIRAKIMIDRSTWERDGGNGQYVAVPPALHRCYEAAKTLVDLVELAYLDKTVYPSRIDVRIDEQPYSASISTIGFKSFESHKNMRRPDSKFGIDFGFMQVPEASHPSGGFITAIPEP